MKLKKLFAGILAVAMMATMAAPAFASTGIIETYPTGTNKISVDENREFTIKKSFTANENGTAPAEEFELTAEKVSSTNTGITDFTTNASDYNLTIGKATKAADGSYTGFKVTLPEFTKPGVFRYKLSETNNHTAGITYDSSDYYLTVYVTQKNRVTTTTTGNDLKYSVRLDRGQEGAENYEKKVDTVNNSYTAEPLTITKTVNGNMGDRTQPFNFKVTFTAPDGKNVKSAITVAGTHGTPEIEGNGATLANNTLTFNENSTSAVVKFTLTHGQTITFTNLPEGVSYKVEELEVPTGYKTYINEADDTATATEGTISNTAVTIDYENVNGDTTIDTGVILDNAPYIALMMVVVAGAAVMIIKKRRHFED